MTMTARLSTAMRKWLSINQMAAFTHDPNYSKCFFYHETCIALFSTILNARGELAYD
jgi:hypothetical protein